jgi:hypothetical protein
MPLTERTIPYKTWIKQSIVEALRRVFNAHQDNLLKTTKVSIEYPNSRARYPAVIVRFFERDIKDAGIGHYEVLTLDNGAHHKFKHYFYSGDIELAIHAMSSLDRDLLADSLIQTLGMGDLENWTNHFFNRIYANNLTEYPKAEFNHINLNTDRIQGYGETQTQAPWLSEDQLVYQTSYRIGIAGGFYSLPPVTRPPVGYVERVDQYPYIGGLEEVPTGRPDDPAEWEPPVE